MRALASILLVLTACDPSAPVEEETPRPDASQLRFDAAMLDPSDAGAPPRDSGPVVPPTRPDTGRDAGRDAGPPPPPSTRYVCRGISTSCSAISNLGCDDQLGCRLGGECTGSARGCYSYYSSYACGSQDGCYWSSYYDNCSGSARSCRGFSSTLSCGGQDGCRWSDRCEGVARSCDRFFTAEGCYGHRGCRWEVE
jgi:hypothetical protein